MTHAAGRNQCDLKKNALNDLCKNDKEKKVCTLSKSSSGLPLFVLDNPLDRDDEPILLDDEPVKKNKSIPQMVSDFISVHNY